MYRSGAAGDYGDCDLALTVVVDLIPVDWKFDANKERMQGPAATSTTAQARAVMRCGLCASRVGLMEIPSGVRTFSLTPLATTPSV